MNSKPRSISQTPRTAGHPFQPRWRNPGGFRPRIDRLKPLVKNRSVLDLGCTSALGRTDWIHAAIRKEARRTVGLDLDLDGVERARALGYDVRLGDAESLALDERFEVVHAGELIEHLDNPRDFLRSVRRHLTCDGLLVLTTPNPFAFTNFLYRIGGHPRINGDHVCWYCEDTLRQLLERNGFETVEVDYVRHRSAGALRGLVARVLRRMLPSKLAWNTLLVTASPTPEDSGR